MAYLTRNGTSVTQRTAASLACVYEILRNAAEYLVYRDFRVGDADAPRFDACEGDSLLVFNSGIDGMAHVLNLVTGASSLIPWDAMAHTTKPKGA